MLYLLIGVASPSEQYIILMLYLLIFAYSGYKPSEHYIIHYALFAYSGYKPSEHYIILMLYLLIVVTSPVNTTLFLCSICL